MAYVSPEANAPPRSARSGCYASRLTTCPFCILQSDRLWIKAEHAVAIRDAYPVSDGHTLIIPSKHVITIYELMHTDQVTLEGSMSATVKKIFMLIASFITILFFVFLFNQTVQVVNSARAFNAMFGVAVMWGLVFSYCIFLVTPAVLWFRLPKRILPPLVAEGPEYEWFMATFKKRLSRNPRLRGRSVESPSDIEAAIQILDKHADDAVVSAASAVFLSTAVLQSGRLDMLVVLAAQTRLIWKVALVYYQRPSLRDFAQLYANVASTAFIAAGVEDIDVDVLMSTIFGSTLAAIPGMHLLASSVLTGSANAFLTLRVGMITKEYCRCTTRVERSRVRRVATLQAAKLLGGIVKNGTVKLSQAAMSQTKSKISGVFSKMTRRGGAPKPEEAG